MRAFRRVSQGLACGLDDWERELLARLALEVRAILQSDEPTDEDAGGSTVLPLTRSDPGARERASGTGRSWRLWTSISTSPPTHVHDRPAASDPVVGVLLPEASEDPVTAMEVSSLTRARLRSGKVDRLARMAAELRAPSGPEATVLVPIGQEAEWLGAINDIRLVLAQRLGIESAQDAGRVHDVAFQEASESETAHEQWYRGTALVYDMVTWWQESLVSALFGGTGPA